EGEATLEPAGQEAKNQDELISKSSELEFTQAAGLLREAEERPRVEDLRFLQDQEALLRAAEDVAQKRIEIEESRKKVEEQARLLEALQERLQIEEESRRQAEERCQLLEQETLARAEE